MLSSGVQNIAKGKEERESNGRAREPRQSERATPQARQTGRLTHKERDAAAYKPPNTTEHTMERNGAHQGTGRGAPWNGAHQRDDGAHHETERSGRRGDSTNGTDTVAKARAARDCRI